jgi:two-component system nitrogen regulation sensor histidine kinase GlnL
MSRNLGRVLDAVLDGVVVIDAKGCVEQLNAEACRILGTSNGAVAGRAVERIGAAPALARPVRTVLETGASVVENEVRLSRRFGDEAVVDVAASPLLDDAGQTDGAVVLLRDRTIGAALREVQHERARAAIFGQIAAGIAHEVKNPLGGIRGAAELIERRSITDKTRETAALIVREVDRIAALLDDFMLLARGDALRLAPFNLHRMLDDVLDLLAVDPLGGRARVERIFDPSIPEFLGDADRLVQVFLNLGRNALEAMAKGEGVLAIATRLRLDHRIDVGGGRRVPTVVVEVRDSGSGIPEEILDQVGTPFFTTKPRGTGLGLALCRHFVALHQGTLQLAGRPGGGTVAQVALPLRRAT